jgi:hypothetical protein
MRPEDTAVLARGRAEAKFAFYKHLAVYVAVGILLVVINFLASPDSFWAIWPILGWGLAIIIHALSVFGARRKKEIIDRMTDQEMGKQDWGRK